MMVSAQGNVQSYLRRSRGSMLTVRKAAEEPMLTHTGFLDFFSRGRVA